MGNSTSHPLNRHASPAHQSTSLPRSQSRPLKRNKRSIVDHPQLLAPQPAPAGPSSPIPIPVQPGNAPPLRPTPPQNNDSFADPDLLAPAIPQDYQNQNSHRLQYNSTRSFGAVRRGGPQGGGWTEAYRRPPPAPFQEETIRSTIPSGLRKSSSGDPAAASHIRPGKPKTQELDFTPEEDEDVDEDVESPGLVPTTLVWRGGGKEVILAGTFNDLEWRARERMRYDPTISAHSITLPLQPGTYRLKFIVDDVWRCSDDMPTATDDETGNLVNYIDVEPGIAGTGEFAGYAGGPGADERQIIDARVMKANRRRTYPAKTQKPAPTPAAKTRPSRSPTTTRYHPPLLPPSASSFWDTPADPFTAWTSGDPAYEAELARAGWERGRDGVLERWTREVPEGLVSAAWEEEEYAGAVAAVRAHRAQREGRGYEREGRRGIEREGRRGEREARRRSNNLGEVWLNVPVPIIPPAPRLPRHLDKVILNTKSSSHHSSSGHSHTSGGSGGSGRRERNGKGKGKSRASTGAGLGMTSLLSSEGAVPGASSGLAADANASRSTPALLAVQPWTQAIEPWAHAQADDSSVLPVPSHVVLHHLGTSAIKNGVLAVSDTTRYGRKYITTIYYKPTM